MSISPLSSSLVNIISSDQSPLGTSGTLSSSAANFGDILSNSLRTAMEADAADKASALQLLAGQSDDLAGMLIDAQKAELSLNLALQIRNKVIDAYSEIMRMQV